MNWPNCPVHGGALMREASMEIHWKRLHHAFAIAQETAVKFDVPPTT